MVLVHIGTMEVTVFAVEGQPIIGSPGKPADAKRGAELILELVLHIYATNCGVELGRLRRPKVRRRHVPTLVDRYERSGPNRLRRCVLGNLLA